MSAPTIDLDADVLGNAAAALRDLTAGPDSLVDPTAEATRRRVMASLGTRRHDHRRRLAFAVFALALSTATLSWAASTGRLTQVLRTLHIVDAAPVAPAVAPPAPEPRDRARRLARTASEPVPASVPASASASVPATRRASRPRVATVPAPAVAVSTPEARDAAAPVDDPDIAAYRRAHALHFHGGAANDALAAWDAYLAAFPRGRFATEARYNRAITLVRLDRTTEARAALAPFAAGEVDRGYRRDEATALREALGRE